jgi:hypothetical protein
MEDGVEISTFSLQAGGHFKKLTPPAFRRTLAPSRNQSRRNADLRIGPGFGFGLNTKTTIII